MKVAIVGAGNAGKDLAAKLCEIGQDVIVVDQNASTLAEVAQQLDVMTVESDGADPRIFEGPALRNLDLLAAVTPRDDTNLLACCWARAAGAQHTLARLTDDRHIRSPLVNLDQLGVDQALVHKEECSKDILDVLDRPGALELTTLLNKSVAALGLKLTDQAPLVNQPLRTFKDDAWFRRVRFIGLVRKGKLTIPDGDAVPMAGDDVYVALPTREIDSFLDWLVGEPRRECRKVIIAGAGELGLALAGLLEKRGMETVLIDRNYERAAAASEKLKRVLVLNANATDVNTLKEAGLDRNTVFAAITGDEEMNIVCCIQAKQIGAGFTIARIDKSEYVPIIGNLNLVDRVVGPNVALIKAILQYVRGELVQDVSLFHRIPGEIQEVIIHPKSKRSGTPLHKLKLPRGAIIAAVQRGDNVFVPTGQYTLTDGDRLAIYCLPSTVALIKSAF